MAGDQVQRSESNESAEAPEVNTSEVEETTETSPDNQETQTSDQSNEEAESKSYRLPDGRQVTADELHEEYTDKLLPEFTRRSQELARLKQSAQERQDGAHDSARQAVKENDILKNVQPEVKEAIIKMVEPVMEQKFEQQRQKELQERREKEFESKIDELEKKFDGSDNKPKFKRQEVLAAMKAEGNSNYDPEAKFREMYFDEFVDASIKEAMKNTGGTKTEKTGQQGSRQKPKSKPPKDWQEARSRLHSRLK